MPSLHCACCSSTPSPGAFVVKIVDLYLQSSDGQQFQVDEDVAYQSITIRNLTEDTGSDFPVPLPNVDGKTLSKVLEYCNKHRCVASGSYAFEDPRANCHL